MEPSEPIAAASSLLVNPLSVLSALRAGCIAATRHEAHDHPLSLWRERIMPVAIPVLERAVPTMDKKFAMLIPRNLSGDSDSFLFC